MSNSLVASVALDLSLQKPLDYLVPEELKSKIHVGSLVEIPLKSTFKKGTVVSLQEFVGIRNLKSVRSILSETPLVSSDLLKLAEWMSEYYCSPLSDILRTILPSSVRKVSAHKEQFFILRKKTREELLEAIIALRSKSPLQAEVLEVMLNVSKGILLAELIEKTETSHQVIEALIKKGFLSKEKMRVDRSPLMNEEFFPTKPKILSKEQEEAFKNICETMQSGSYATHLLFGVTGSGKTEIYLQAIGKALEMGKGTIMLVPEIALTAQTIERFRSRFEGHIAILHHRLSPGERYDEWKKIHRGDAKIVIGARSAVFSPVQNLGLIIVDEEHEASYKQSEGMPTYHARDVAVMRGSLAKASVVLGSATPSLESYYNALNQKYRLNKLLTRPTASLLPKVEIIDMRHEYEKKKGFTLFSEKLLNGIEKRIEKGEQSILFLNRRGFHTLLMCTSCGQSVKCPSCDLSLTFHKKENSLSCHLCGHSKEPLHKCPSCANDQSLKYRGMGTEQVEAALYAIFPKIRVMRLDADTTKQKGSHETLFKAFKTGKADVLIGTQIVAKGLHFPEVTLVGILNSDLSLNIPDFRSGETTFQLLTQVSGRAGRGVLEGEVLIQTSIPENSVIQKALQQNFEAFYQEEIESRKAFLYPPFSSLVKLRFTGKDATLTTKEAETFRLKLAKLLPIDCEITPPQPGAYAKIKEEFRFQFLLKGPKMGPLTSAVKQVMQNTRLPKGIKILIDVNPSSTFF